MRIFLEPVTLNDRVAIMDIFNFYTESGFAAYTEEPMPYELFESFIQYSSEYPAITARDEFDEVIGFGMLRPYSAIPVFASSAEMTCFLKNGYTGRGIGRSILECLEAEARRMAITSILVSISSLNEGSIRFHLNNGFRECGRLKEIGEKRGARFDVVYCQKMI
ncbi:MAG: N-acetyltransferase [Chlorobiaceae bacterium]|nr:N-acetyltransferase [Chlorobiaceae bacterium]